MSIDLFDFFTVSKTKYSLCIFPKKVWQPINNCIPDKICGTTLWDKNNTKVYWLRPVKMTLVKDYVRQNYYWFLVKIEPVTFKEYLKRGNYDY